MSNTLQIGLTVASRATPLKPFATQVFDDAIKAGLGWARLQVQWDHIELIQGTYDPNALAVLNDAVSYCNKVGLKIQFPIQKPPSFHLSSTVMGQGPNGPWLAWDAQATATFASFLASRYNGNNGHGFIDAFEIGNEDFSSDFIPGAPATPQGQVARDPNKNGFIAVLQACAPVIRQNSPHALVGMGSLWWEDSNYHTYFMQALYAANVGSLFDYANIHFYSGNVDPTVDTSPTRKSLAGQINEVWQVMEANGDGDKQVAVTEFGWMVPGDVSEATRQAYFTKAFDSASATGHVGIMNIYTMHDIPASIDQNTYAFSLTHPSADPTSSQVIYTPSYTTIQQYIAAHGGNTPPPPPPPPPNQAVTLNLTGFTGSIVITPQAGSVTVGS